jgi:molecular chaperone GrpE (heat shock protein)
MKRTSPSQGKDTTKDLIGEMMLAKTMLEEKNELLDRKDSLVRELQAQCKQLQSELAECRLKLEDLALEAEAIRDRALSEGRHEAVSEVVRLAADYEKAEARPESGVHLFSRLIRLFREKYGLEVIDRVPERIDPEVHRVIEVVREPGNGDSRLQVLAKGYRVHGKLVCPALVKVYEGPPKGA